MSAKAAFVSAQSRGIRGNLLDFLRSPCQKYGVLLRWQKGCCVGDSSQALADAFAQQSVFEQLP